MSGLDWLGAGIFGGGLLACLVISVAVEWVWERRR